MEKHFKASVSKIEDQFFLELKLPEIQKINLSDEDQSSLPTVFSYLLKLLLSEQSLIVFDFEPNDVDSGINEIAESYIKILNQDIAEVFRQISDTANQWQANLEK